MVQVNFNLKKYLLASAQVSITGGLPKSGLLVIECRQGQVISRSILVLVTSDTDLAHELGEVMLQELCPDATPAAAGTSQGESPAVERNPTHIIRVVLTANLSRDTMPRHHLTVPCLSSPLAS